MANYCILLRRAPSARVALVEVSAAAGEEDVRGAGQRQRRRLKLVLRHCLGVESEACQGRRGIDGEGLLSGRVETVCVNVDRGRMFVFTSAPAGSVEREGLGGEVGGCWPLSKQFQIRLASPTEKGRRVSR